eukprot:2873667-Alexandrium_andersonii.AAC.1
MPPCKCATPRCLRTPGVVGIPRAAMPAGFLSTPWVRTRSTRPHAHALPAAPDSESALSHSGSSVAD